MTGQMIKAIQQAMTELGVWGNVNAAVKIKACEICGCSPHELQQAIDSADDADLCEWFC